MSYSRRHFLRQSTVSLGAIAGTTTLAKLWCPTECSGGLGAFAEVVHREDTIVPAAKLPAPWSPAEPNILGPYYRRGAPFRAKTTPPLEPGETLLVRGHIWGFDTRRPLPNAVIDIWHANARGRYDNDDPQHPPHEKEFYCRSRLVTDEAGYYEYQSIRPGRYQVGVGAWRPSHIH